LEEEGILRQMKEGKKEGRKEKQINRRVKEE
jgi:hypothetical protein